MHINALTTMAQLEEFLAGTQPVTLALAENKNGAVL